MKFSTIISLTVVASMTVLSAMAAPAAPVCNEVCPPDNNSVCAKLQSGELKTFSNACTLSHFNCENPTALAEFDFYGDCSATPVCETVCPMISFPICAKLPSGEFRDFVNECFLGVYNCQNPTAIATVVPETACGN
ncbi:hypothetical protein BGX30_000525 [Mortierella sp. GBA39]|nr:hypothetical protein BGX30_000525 [Mortierella sp. GBA39]